VPCCSANLDHKAPTRPQPQALSPQDSPKKHPKLSQKKSRRQGSNYRHPPHALQTKKKTSDETSLSLSPKEGECAQLCNGTGSHGSALAIPPISDAETCYIRQAAVVFVSPCKEGLAFASLEAGMRRQGCDEAVMTDIHLVNSEPGECRFFHSILQRGRECGGMDEMELHLL
jgi:hypothetical protein